MLPRVVFSIDKMYRGIALLHEAKLRVSCHCRSRNNLSNTWVAAHTDADEHNKRARMGNRWHLADFIPPAPPPSKSYIRAAVIDLGGQVVDVPKTSKETCASLFAKVVDTFVS